MSIGVITTAVESPFTNGLIEQHKTLVDFQPVLAWSVNAKNSLTNVHRISPFKLELG